MKLLNINGYAKTKSLYKGTVVYIYIYNVFYIFY